MIEVLHISKAFGEKEVFRDLSVVFNKEDITFVLGKSGVGKSVLLKHLIGLLNPDEGTITVEGETITGMSEIELTRIRKKCGMVFQFPALLDSLTVRENVSFGIYAHRLSQNEKEIEEKVLRLLKYVRLGESILDKFPPELSFGVQKRVAIARTLAIEPEYLLFDEPTTGMDPITTHSLNRLIVELREKLRVSSIVVSHDIQSAFEIGDRLLLLDDAKLVFDGSKEAFKSSAYPLCQAFLKEGLN